jgi:hypothetical protein
MTSRCVTARDRAAGLRAAASQRNDLGSRPTLPRPGVGARGGETLVSLVFHRNHGQTFSHGPGHLVRLVRL